MGDVATAAASPTSDAKSTETAESEENSKKDEQLQQQPPDKSGAVADTESEDCQPPGSEATTPGADESNSPVIVARYNKRRLTDVRDDASVTTPKDKKVKKKKKKDKKVRKTSKKKKKERTVAPAVQKQQATTKIGSPSEPSPTPPDRVQLKSRERSSSSGKRWRRRNSRSPSSDRPSGSRPSHPPPPPPPSRRQNQGGKGKDPAWQAQWRGLQCDICGALIKGTGHPKGDANSLKLHQKTSSRCLAKSGLGQPKERCAWGCGRLIASNDAWAAEQHSWHCPMQRKSRTWR